MNDFRVRGIITEIICVRKDNKKLKVLIDTSKMILVKNHFKMIYARLNKKSKTYYALGTTHDGKTELLHRFLTGAPKGLAVDHINHNTLDNRMSEIRVVSNQQNSQNLKGAKITSKSGVLGVYEQRGKWIATVTVSGKSQHLGSYETIEEASKMVEEARSTFLPYSKEALKNKSKNFNVNLKTETSSYSTNKTSKVKGVTKYRDRYKVRFIIAGRDYYIGLYDDLETAESVAKEAIGKTPLELIEMKNKIRIRSTKRDMKHIS